MKTVKKTVILYIDIYPIDHESQQPCPCVTTFGGTTPMEGYTRKTLSVEIDVPVRYEEIPASAVKEIQPA